MDGPLPIAAGSPLNDCACLLLWWLSLRYNRTLDRLADSFDDQGKGDAAAGGGIAAAGGRDPSTRQKGRFYSDGQ